MAIFDEKNEIRERCKGVHCVDLDESFPTRVYLQNRRRYSRERAPRSLGGKFNSIFTSLLRSESKSGLASPNYTASFRGLVLGCIDVSDIENRRIFQHSSAAE